MGDSINSDTNVDNLSEEQLLEETVTSKNRARVQLLDQIHTELEVQAFIETVHDFDPNNDMSFSGEFKAIGI